MGNDTKKVLEGHDVFVVGPANLQNEFLVYVIEREFGGTVRFYDGEPTHLYTEDFFADRAGVPTLVMIDGGEYPAEGNLRELASRDILPTCKIVLYNLDGETGVEKTAFSRSIRGFFYRHDSLDMFRKGIAAVCRGEVWVPRRVLLNYVYENMEDEQPVNRKKTTLTQREIEILSLVSTGASNEIIAEKMFISTNTVKTHLYNVFKKIKVPNRLQAVLWASKNL